jgi:2-desacetyl-2-hydroxyethyl bacteriochlorophyllide A dehydrogenase
MFAAVLNSYNKIEWQEVTEPEPGDNDVLIQVTFASICGTDEHIFTGEFHPRTQLPLIPGHEFVGIVAEKGTNVKGFHIGDKVVVDPIIWCGECDACRAGHYPACSSLKLIGIDLDGGFAELISVPGSMVLKLPGNIQGQHAALIELLSIGFHASNRAGVKRNDNIVIWGCGKVGNAILLASKIKTDGNIFLVDILDERLARAKEAFPGIVTINASRKDPLEVIREQTENKGVDIAFEAVGHAHLGGNLVHPVRGCVQAIRGGGIVCVLGLSDQPAPLIMKELIWKEAKIIASRVSHGEFSETIDYLKEGNLDPDYLITATRPMKEAQSAFEMLKAEPEKHLKILLEL